MGWAFVQPGQVFAEFGPRAHWVENKGPDPVVFTIPHGPLMRCLTRRIGNGRFLRVIRAG
jgi:hypothetical protein